MNPFTVLILGILSALTLYASECSVYYKVKKGDSLWKIAKEYKTSIGKLLELNPKLKNRKYLRPGEKICLKKKISKSKKVVKTKTKTNYKKSYVVYRVKRGDSLIKIAKKFGVSVKEIKRVNKLKGNRIYVGQKLKIPVYKEVKTVKKEQKVYRTTSKYPKVVKERVRKRVIVIYRVRRGDTLIKIAKRFRTSVKEIKRINRLKGNLIRVGQKLKIPVYRWVYIEKYAKIPKISLAFLPVDGKVVRDKRGVTIYTDCGKPVKAVESGKVIYSGNDISVYGNIVILDHGTYTTVYAYNERNTVKADQKVKKGETIGYVGIKPDEGRCALHFEIRDKQGNLYNPLMYLSKKK
ncbi:LysM peptidoglycan-binding domain-containing protein [Aquifex aeolicus]|uniref:Lipoprotein n=1 Tax=Aquifex aeolicus (strain VF5) TaxID=224324 RepID=O66890_AQUAE|nr:LysM peptidoglycan-binding domain-containing protein [Aquifex aeolicus]AAC06844.1 lipoprotein [Aquifex aeolicus VF5]